MEDGIYYTPEYNKLQVKENVTENLIHLSGASSEPSSSLIRFYGSDMAKVDPGDGGGSAAPVSTSALCLSLVQRSPLRKMEVEDTGNQGGRK